MPITTKPTTNAAPNIQPIVKKVESLASRALMFSRSRAPKESWPPASAGPTIDQKSALLDASRRYGERDDVGIVR